MMDRLRVHAEPRDDDLCSFDAFYRAAAAHTFDQVRRIVPDRETARDVTQEAYLVMLQCWPSRQHSSLKNNRQYVMGIAANKAIDWYRRRCREVELDDEIEISVDDAGFGAVMDDMSLETAVREVIKKQPPRRRAVAVLFFLQGFDYCEIAKELDMAESTARTHVQRLRSLLKPHIDQNNDRNRGGERP